MDKIADMVAVEKACLGFFRRDQKRRLDSFLAAATRDLARMERSGASIRDSFFKDKGLQLYIALARKSPSAIIDAVLLNGAGLAKQHESDANRVKTREQLAKWWLETYEPHNEPPQKVFERMSRLSYDLFTYVRTSGYRPAVLQSSVQVSFCSDKPIDVPTMVEEIGVWFPMVKPLVENESKSKEFGDCGWRPFGIMEPSLSEYCCYFMYVRDGQAVVVSSRGFRGEQIELKGYIEDVVADAIKKFRRNADED